MFLNFDIFISILEGSFLKGGHPLALTSWEDHWKRLYLTVLWLSLVIYAPWWYLANCCFSFPLEILPSLEPSMIFQSDHLVFLQKEKDLLIYLYLLEKWWWVDYLFEIKKGSGNDLWSLNIEKFIYFTFPWNN